MCTWECMSLCIRGRAKGGVRPLSWSYGHLRCLLCECWALNSSPHDCTAVLTTSHLSRPFLYVFVVCLFIVKSHCVAQVVLELVILPPQLPRCWDYRLVPSCPPLLIPLYVLLNLVPMGQLLVLIAHNYSILQGLNFKKAYLVVCLDLGIKPRASYMLRMLSPVSPVLKFYTLNTI